MYNYEKNYFQIASNLVYRSAILFRTIIYGIEIKCCYSKCKRYGMFYQKDDPERFR